MKTIFKKTDLPLLAKIAGKRATFREQWGLARAMRTGDGFMNHPASAVMLLEKGAYAGDPWCMCELARTLFEDGGDPMLPVALSWWHKAAQKNDAGTLWDLENRPIPERIRKYTKGKTAYACIEMRCAMLTEWILTRMGRDKWEDLDYVEQRRRVAVLMQAVAPHLHIKAPGLYIKPVLQVGEIYADGVAHSADHKIGIRDQVFSDYHRLIQVLFHELGHFVLYSMWNGKDTTQMQRFGITEDRVQSWHDKDMGLEEVTSEEDPDTLGYGVYTTWLTLFGL